MTLDTIKDPLLYIDTMVESIVLILEYAKGKTLNDYLNNSQLQDAIHMRLQLLGESASKLPVTFRDKHPDIPWLEVRALRNVISHDYSSIKPERIWDTIQNDLPVLLKQLKELKT
jgi:uncharacterized protein with HEPN domain